jgi:hypothetical protein
LTSRDKLNLDIFWLKDDALADPDLLPPPDEVAAEVVESLEAALASFRSGPRNSKGCRPRLGFACAGATDRCSPRPVAAGATPIFHHQTYYYA